MIRIKNRKWFDEYLQQQLGLYPNFGIIRTVIIDSSSQNEYYIIGEHDYTDEIDYIVINPKQLYRGQHLEKIRSVSREMFMGSSYYIDKKNEYIGRNYRKKTKDFKEHIERINKYEYEL